MSTPFDHIHYLSQEIGARPAGTEEEQQAALYIAERLKEESNLPVGIEDITCNSNPRLAQTILFGISFVAAALTIPLKVVSIPAIVICIAAALLLAAEIFDKPLLSRLFMKGVSQNVVAKYEPTFNAETQGARRRKIVIVANYDSGKVRHDLKNSLLGVRRYIQIAECGAMVAIPLIILVRMFVTIPALTTATLVLLGIAMALTLLPVISYIVESASQYTEAANANAAGVAVMMEVARRIGTGEAMEVSTTDKAPERRGLEAAIAAGLVPDGATIEYDEAPYAQDGTERGVVSGEGLAAAKAAIAALTNEPLLETPAAVSPEEAVAAMVGAGVVGQTVNAAIQDGADLTSQVANMGEFGTSDTHSDENGSFRIQDAGDGVEFSIIADDADGQDASTEDPSQKLAEEASPWDELVSQQPLVQTLVEETQQAPSVPDWFTAGTANARKNTTQDGIQEAGEYRSRYADYPVNVEAEAADDAQEQGLSVAEQPVALHPAMEQPQVEYPLVSHTAERMNSQERFDTVSMPALDMGNLDLDQLRAQAEHPAANADVARSAAVELPAIEIPEIGPQVQPVATVQPEDASLNGEGSFNNQAIPIAIPMITPENASPQARAQAPILTLPAIEPFSEAPAEPRLVTFEELRTRVPMVPMDIPAVEASSDQGGAGDAGTASAGADAPEVRRTSSARPTKPAPTKRPGRTGLLNLPTIGGDGDAASASGAAVMGGAAAASGVAGVTGASVMNGPAAAKGSAPGSRLADDTDATVAFTPVSATEDQFVDDASDEGFGGGLGSFSDQSFVPQAEIEMPKSRLARLFGGAGGKKRKRIKEESASEWLGVDEDFDARKAGKNRGGWESFREDWEGGSFSGIRMDRDPSRKVEPLNLVDNTRDVTNQEMSEFAAVAAEAARLAGKNAFTEEDYAAVYSFASGDINTEVWFVALGAGLAENGGIKAFLSEHVADMRGAVLINLEALGGGRLAYLEREGELTQKNTNARMRRYAQRASQASDVEIIEGVVDWRDSAASYALKHHMQAITIAGMDGNKPARFAEADDIIENIDAAMLDEAADYVIQLIKNI